MGLDSDLECQVERDEDGRKAEDEAINPLSTGVDVKKASATIRRDLCIMYITIDYRDLQKKFENAVDKTLDEKLTQSRIAHYFPQENLKMEVKKEKQLFAVFFLQG